jgi:hypothetical protein
MLHEMTRYGDGVGRELRGIGRGLTPSNADKFGPGAIARFPDLCCIWLHGVAREMQGNRQGREGSTAVIRGLGGRFGLAEVVAGCCVGCVIRMSKSVAWGRSSIPVLR